MKENEGQAAVEIEEVLEADRYDVEDYYSDESGKIPVRDFRGNPTNRANHTNLYSETCKSEAAFLPQLGFEIGAVGAAILTQLDFWLPIPYREHYGVEGRTSIAELASVFETLSIDKIRRTLYELEQSGFVTTEPCKTPPFRAGLGHGWNMRYAEAVAEFTYEINGVEVRERTGIYFSY